MERDSCENLVECAHVACVPWALRKCSSDVHNTFTFTAISNMSQFILCMTQCFFICCYCCCCCSLGRMVAHNGSISSLIDYVWMHDAVTLHCLQSKLFNMNTSMNYTRIANDAYNISLSEQMMSTKCVWYFQAVAIDVIGSSHLYRATICASHT